MKTRPSSCLSDHYHSPSPMLLLRSTPSYLNRPVYHTLSKPFTTTAIFKMPETLQKSTIDNKVDATTAAQWDDKTPKSKQIEEFYKTVDGMKTGLLTTIRPDIGPVARSMAVAKVPSQLIPSHIKVKSHPTTQANPPHHQREGPDFLFLANKHSNKFSDLEHDKTAQVTFQNSSSQDWVSVSGTVTTAANDDPRIKQLYSKPIAAWFGDLGDGVHNGTADDPRMALIEVKAKYISYWKSTVTSLGFAKEVAQASLMGSVANTGDQRQLVQEDIEAMRKTDAAK